MNKFTGLVRRCIDDYKMIDGGETIAVGVSGGKDSLALLCALAELRKYYPKPYELCAITVDLGYGADYAPVEKLCGELGVPYIVKRTEIGHIVFDLREEKNPCALCSKMRRGAIHDIMAEQGIKKVALGHHYDDAVETFVMSLVYEGRISCFQPVTYMSKTGVTQIRPMLYATEGMVKKLVQRLELPVVKNPCPRDGYSKREEVKTLIRDLQEKYPDVKTKMFGAMQRLPLEGWGYEPHERVSSKRSEDKYPPQQEQQSDTGEA